MDKRKHDWNINDKKKLQDLFCFWCLEKKTLQLVKNKHWTQYVKTMKDAWNQL